MLYFNDCKVVVQDSGVLAETVSVDISNNLRPIYVLGKKGAVNQSLFGGLQGGFRFSYSVEVSNEPNFGLVSYIKDNSDHNASYSAIQLSAGGLSGSCYLTSYDLSLEANGNAQASVDWGTFQKISGDFVATPYSLNTSGSSGIAHSWTTKFYLNDIEVLTGKIYSFNYSFRSQWEPFYSLGNIAPTQVNFGNAEEKFSLGLETYKAANVSGEFIDSYLGINKVRIYSLADIITGSDAYLEFNFATGVVASVQSSAAMDDIMRTTVTIQKFF